MLPGSTTGDVIPGSKVSMDKINQLLDLAGEETGNVAASIAESTGNAVSDAIGDYEYLKSDMLGGASNLLDDASSTAYKVQTDLIQKPIHLLQDAYGIRASIGYDVPTMEYVNYANATGDYESAIRGDPVLGESGEGYEKPPIPVKPIDGGGSDSTIDPVPPTGTQPPTTGTQPPVSTGIPPVSTTQPPPVTQPPTAGGVLPTGGQPTGDANGGQIQGQGFGNIGDQVIGVPIDPSIGPRCPPNYALIGIENGNAICYLSEKPETIPLPPEPTELPPPPDDINTPYDDDEEEPTETEQPPPVIDPATCAYAKRPTSKIGEGCTVPKGPGPVPFWVEMWCSGCDMCWATYAGDESPEVDEGHVLHGPLQSLPSDMTAYVHAALNCRTGQEEDEEESEDEEEEDTGEEEEETDDEGAGEFDDEGAGGDIDDGPKPDDRPQQRPDQYCNYIGGVAGAMQDLVPSFDVAVGIDKPETALGRLVQGAFRNNIMLLLSVFPNTFRSGIAWARKQIQFALSSLACNRAAMFPMAITLGAMQAIQRWFGFLPHQSLNTLTQASNTLCQSNIPGKNEIDVAFLRGDIDEDTWKCWHKANGNYIDPAKKVMHSQRAKLDPTQIDWLFRRKLLTQQEYDKFMRESGVLFEEDKRNIHNYNQVFPSLSDNVRLMTRDTADETTIDWRASDESFKAKYAGKVKEFFDALGITEEVAKYYWRAHWHIPSFTMLTEMLHRLQNDMVGPDLQVTLNDVKAALLQDDWHPAWVDKMIAISYKAVTKTDAVRAYMIHASDDETLHRQLRATGYRDDDAMFYVNYYKMNRRIQDTRRSGYPTLRTLANQYARCEITESDFRDTVSKIVVNEDQEKAAIEAAILSRDVRKRQQAIKSIRRPYTLGILDDGEASQALAQAGVDPSCVGGLIDNWKLDRLRRDKFLTADQLCGMRERGILNAAQQLIALIRSGWNKEDAGLIVANCGAILSEKAARKADTMARRAAADAKRAQREAERIRRLQECGPVPCPRPRGANSPASVARPQNQGQTITDTIPNIPKDQ